MAEICQHIDCDIFPLSLLTTKKLWRWTKAQLFSRQITAMQKKKKSILKTAVCGGEQIRNVFSCICRAAVSNKK